MYAHSLGVMELTPLDMPLVNSDPMDGPPDGGSDPTALTPTVVYTGDPPAPFVPPVIQPVTVNPSTVPYQLPDLVVTAPAPAGVPWGLLLSLVGLYAVSKGGGSRSGRSWGD